MAEHLDRHLGRRRMASPRLRPVEPRPGLHLLGGEDWTPEQSQLSETAQAAMFTNLLTEDNLPSYHREIAASFGRDGAWGTWVGRWTAEEDRHGLAMRDYLVVTRGVDPVEFERARMDYMTSGYEPATRRARGGGLRVAPGARHPGLPPQHRQGDRRPDRRPLLARIAKDENLHMIFYRNIVSAALEIAPDATMQAITEEVIDFQMPGATMAGFRRSSMIIAKAGIYDLGSTTTR